MQEINTLPVIYDFKCVNVRQIYNEIDCIVHFLLQRGEVILGSDVIRGGRLVFFCLQFLEVVGDFLHCMPYSQGSVQIQAALEHLQLGRREFFNLSKPEHCTDGHFYDDGNSSATARQLKGTGGYFPVTHNFMTSIPSSKIQIPNLMQILPCPGRKGFSANVSAINWSQSSGNCTYEAERNPALIWNLDLELGIWDHKVMSDWKVTRYL